MKAETVAVTMTPAPFMVDILGLQAPALSMFVGLAAVIITRVMLISTEPRTKQGWWYYNVSLTLLLALITFVIILDRKLGPGFATVLGIGVGASGILVVDVMKKWVLNFFRSFPSPSQGDK
jgi:hypothetical protein